MRTSASSSFSPGARFQKSNTSSSKGAATRCGPTSSNDFESLDYGFEWQLDNGARCSFIWAWEFEKQKVSFSKAPITPFGKHWDATERWRARGMIESRIVRVEVDWLISYAQAVYVHFESGAWVQIAARNEHEPEESHLLTLFFVAS